MRILPSLSKEQEWSYLVGETLIGERLIVPALLRVRHHPSLPSSLRKPLDQQIEEETHHLTTYLDILGGKQVRGSGYDLCFDRLLKQFSSATEGLFALQGMLEGISLGALHYRLSHWENSPSAAFDQIVADDEIRHVSLSFDHFHELKKCEGNLDAERFKAISRAINHIFRNSFSGLRISQLVWDRWQHDVDPKAIESSLAMASFRRASCRELLLHRQSFMESYLHA